MIQSLAILAALVGLLVVLPFLLLAELLRAVLGFAT